MQIWPAWEWLIRVACGLALTFSLWFWLYLQPLIPSDSWDYSEKVVEQTAKMYGGQVLLFRHLLRLRSHEHVPQLVRYFNRLRFLRLLCHCNFMHGKWPNEAKWLALFSLQLLLPNCFQNITNCFQNITELKIISWRISEFTHCGWCPKPQHSQVL